jgi:hypothetical protein
VLVRARAGHDLQTMSSEMRVPSLLEAAYRESLLERFHSMGFSPALLPRLRGSTADAQWRSLERLVLDPETRPEDVLRGNWAPFWHDRHDEDPA